jgi:hypothetical protein
MTKLDYKTPEPQSDEDITERMHRWENWILFGIGCAFLGFVLLLVVLSLWLAAAVSDGIH